MTHPRQPHVVAHRGASAYTPENTFAAFDKALELGCTDMELDLRISKDGALVVMHDETVDRTTNGHGEVCDLTLAELQRLDAGAWYDARFAGQRIPTLEEVLSRYPMPARFYIEVKAPGQVLEEKLAKLILDQHAKGRVMAISFYPECLWRLRQRVPGLRVGFLAVEPTREALDTAWSLGGETIAIPADRLTPEVMRMAHETGLWIECFGLHTRRDARDAIAAGADGLHLDDPTWGKVE